MANETGINLNVVVTREEFKKKEQPEQLLLIYETITQLQRNCKDTKQEYDGHFTRCDNRVVSIEKKVKDVVTPIVNRKKDIGMGAGLGGIGGLTVFEAGRYLWEWIKGHIQ